MLFLINFASCLSFGIHKETIKANSFLIVSPDDYDLIIHSPTNLISTTNESRFTISSNMYTHISDSANISTESNEEAQIMLIYLPKDFCDVYYEIKADYSLSTNQTVLSNENICILPQYDSLAYYINTRYSSAKALSDVNILKLDEFNESEPLYQLNQNKKYRLSIINLFIVRIQNKNDELNIWFSLKIARSSLKKSHCSLLPIMSISAKDINNIFSGSYVCIESAGAYIRMTTIVAIITITMVSFIIYFCCCPKQHQEAPASEKIYE